MSLVSDETHRRVRQHRPPAFADFMDLVYSRMPEADRDLLGTDTGGYVNGVVEYAVERLGEFGDATASMVAGVYQQSPTGERFVLDPPRCNEVVKSALFLDADGQLVSVRNPDLSWVKTKPDDRQVLEMTRYQSYEVLTGPLSGKSFNEFSRPLPPVPIYRPGVVQQGAQGIGSPEPVRSVWRPPLEASGAPAGGQPAVPEIFFSYSHRDEKLRAALEKHLAPLKREGVIAGWHDREIGAGEEWQGQIDAHLNSADVILLLVSPDFLASDFCFGVELKRALERHHAGEARVIPVILRPVDWSNAPFSALQAVPKDGKPVTEWNNRDRAFMDITVGIRRAIATLYRPAPH